MASDKVILELWFGNVIKIYSLSIATNINYIGSPHWQEAASQSSLRRRIGNMVKKVKESVIYVGKNLPLCRKKSRDHVI